MVKRKLPLPLVLLLLATCKDSPTDSSTSNPQSVSVLTQHNDITRSGWNDNETALTTSNVNVRQFGEVFTLTVDDQVYGQPLVVGHVFIGDGYHNVVYIATVNNTLYAYDGDNGTLYWRKSFTAPGMRPPRNTDMTGACGGTYTNFSGNIGIVGTPVIDSARGTMYFVTRSTTGSTFVQYLHAVNIVDGNEIAGSPTKITATATGYAGGTWESGTGMAADAQGNLYVVTGNGTVGDTADPTSPTNRGESALKLTLAGSTLHVASYFTPQDYQFLNDNDLDYGTMGGFLIPNSTYFLTGGKDGNLYLLNKDAMGGYVPSANQVQQVVALGSSANMHCQATYYKGGAKEFIYAWSENQPLRAIPFDPGSGLMDPQGQIVAGGGGPTGQSGAVLSVSSNGSKDGTGILWASYASTGDAESFVSPGILRAFDANDVTRELWNNQQNVARDGAGNYARFSAPTIANGHVYLPTFSSRVVVYGLR